MRRFELPLLLGAGAIALLLGDHLGLAVCPTAGLLGIPCPSCGLTRAAAALLSGRWAEALTIHPLVVVVLPALALGAMLHSLGKAGVAPLGPGSRWLLRGAEAAALLLAVLALSLWIARFFGGFGGPVTVDPWFW